MKHIARLALAPLLAFCVLACNRGEAPAPESVDRSQLCLGGGGTLNGTTNECVCAGGQKWNGMRCEHASDKPGSAVPEGVAPATSDDKVNADGSHESASIRLRTEPATPAPAPAAGPGGSAKDQEAPAGDRLVAAACKRAKGAWLEMEGYCRCPLSGVLVGQTCRKLRGSITDDACLYAVHKGKWHAGDCDCADGLVFSPNRGGCVPRMRGDMTVLRRECESTMNNGKWDAGQNRCRCPEGRIWKDELCQVAHLLSSGEVCESEFNGGKWDYDRKKCACPPGRIWLDRACKRASGIPMKTICESENGGGLWNEALQECKCAKGPWDPGTQTCP